MASEGKDCGQWVVERLTGRPCHKRHWTGRQLVQHLALPHPDLTLRPFRFSQWRRPGQAIVLLAPPPGVREARHWCLVENGWVRDNQQPARVRLGAYPYRAWTVLGWLATE